MRTDLEGYRFRVKIRLRLRMGAFGPKGYRYWVSFSCQNFAWAKLSRLGGAVWGHRRPSWGQLLSLCFEKCVEEMSFVN